MDSKTVRFCSAAWRVSSAGGGMLCGGATSFLWERASARRFPVRTPITVRQASGLKLPPTEISRQRQAVETERAGLPAGPSAIPSRLRTRDKTITPRTSAF
ncbi:hypothetical protein LG3211_1689 [Lysobacter gummosus]|nr:hypothetical protein LG3211_1689 [Lysobacter gummosus]